MGATTWRSTLTVACTEIILKKRKAKKKEGEGCIGFGRRWRMGDRRAGEYGEQAVHQWVGDKQETLYQSLF